MNFIAKLAWTGLMAILLAAPLQAQKQIVVAYVTSGSDELPDMSLMTHIDYAFGHVNETFDGIVISRPERLEAIVSAKGEVKVCLSVGGWGSGRFSEMAATEAGRKAFARDCARVIEEYGLDGIDLDWEYPTSSAAGISSSPDDTDNFTLLVQEIRREVGLDRLLTLATPAGARYFDFPAILPLVDWVNVMSYDMGRPPMHNAALYKSGISRWMTTDGAVKAHLKAGVPLDKMVVGMPFYGHGDRKTYPDYVNYKDLQPPVEGIREVWDSVGHVPYYADAEGRMVLGFDNVQSITDKCEYIVEQGVRGAMYWEYNCDNATHDLARTVARIVLGR